MLGKLLAGGLRKRDPLAVRLLRVRCRTGENCDGCEVWERQLASRGYFHQPQRFAQGLSERARCCCRKASSGCSEPPCSTCQKVQPLHDGAPCSAAPTLWIEPACASQAIEPSARTLRRPAALGVGQRRARPEPARFRPARRTRRAAARACRSPSASRFRRAAASRRCARARPSHRPSRARSRSSAGPAAAPPRRSCRCRRTGRARRRPASCRRAGSGRARPRASASDAPSSPSSPLTRSAPPQIGSSQSDRICRSSFSAFIAR